MAITPEDIISWGGNTHGQCGQGERAEIMSVKPRSIKPLQGISIAQVVCGRYHTLCVTATSQVLSPLPPEAFLTDNNAVTISHLGKQHGCVGNVGMADDTMLPPWLQVYSWGCNSSGQLGLGDFVDRRAPAHIEGLWALPVAGLAAGDSHSAALTASGFLFAWGANEKGQLGLPRAAEAAAQVQRTASERQRARRVVNQRFLTAMLEMGIPLDKAELALSETGNVGVEVGLPLSYAFSWSLAHASA